MATRYSLKPYKSVFRDPGSVQINELLRNRFQDAFNKDDALSGAVDQMQAADFEGDIALKNELENTTRTALEDRSSRGGYETMGLDVARSARTFAKDYAPIKQNFDLVQAYKKKLDDAYAEGDIDPETYRGMFAMSAHGYKGLNKNEDGTIDEGSYFSGYNFVKDQDISALMSEAMKDYAVKKGGSIVQVVGQGPGAMYTIKKGSKYEMVPQEDVAAIFKDVIADPNVTAYLQQKSKLRTFNLSDEDIQKSISNELYGNEDDPNNNGLYGALQEANAKGKKKEAQAIEEVIKEKESLLKGTGVETDDQLMEMRRRYAEQGVIGSETTRELGAAIRKFAYKNVWSEYIQDYDKKWLQDYERYMKDYTPVIVKGTEETEIKNVGGDDEKSIQSYIDGQNQLITNAARDFNLALLDNDGNKRTYVDSDGQVKEFGNYTVEDIMNGNVPDEIKALAESFKSKIQVHKEQVHFQESLLQKAYNDLGLTGTDQDFETAFGENVFKGPMGPGKQAFKGKELVAAVSKYVGREVDYKEAIELLDRAADQQFRSSAIEDYDERVATMKAGAKFLRGVGKIMYDDYNVTVGGLGQIGEDKYNMGWVTVEQLKRFSAEYNTKRQKDLDRYLEKNSSIYAGGQTSNVMPNVDPRKAQEDTKAINKFFLKKPLDETMKIYYDGQKQTTATIANLMEEKGMVEHQITEVTFDTTPYLGEPSLQMKVQGKDKDGRQVNEVIKVPYSEIQMEGMDQYFNQPGYRLQMDINKAKQSGLDGTSIGFYTPDGNLATAIDFAFTPGKSGGDKVTILNSDGTVNQVSTAGGLFTITNANGKTVQVTLADLVNNASMQGLSFRTITK